MVVRNVTGEEKAVHKCTGAPAHLPAGHRCMILLHFCTSFIALMHVLILN